MLHARHVQDVLDGLRARGVLARAARPTLQAIWAMPVWAEAILGRRCRRCAPPAAQGTPSVRPVMGDVGARRVCAPLASRTFCASARCPRPASSRPTITSSSCTVRRPAAEHRKRATRGPSHADATASQPSALIVIASLRTDDLFADQLATLAVTADKSWLGTDAYIDLHPLPNGYGRVLDRAAGRTSDSRARRARCRPGPLSTLGMPWSRTGIGESACPGRLPATR